MKYMTKEWYATMQKTSFHLLLKISKQAGSFSEDYFKKLYKTEEKAWLRLQEDVSNVKFEDVFPDEFYMDKLDNSRINPEAYEEARKKYFEMQEQARSNFDQSHSVFDPEQEKKNFRQALRYNIKHLKENLPDEILQKVADIRVLALNRTSAEIKKEISTYCRANEKACAAASKAYWKEYEKTFKHGEPAFAENFNFHDCNVISCRKKGKDLVLTLDNSDGFTNIDQVVFKQSSILKQDKPLRGAWWLYDEIYKTADGYEIHALLQKEDLIDFIITATDVEYK